MPDKARVAVIGTGWWTTQAHLPALVANPKAELVALADPREDVLAKAAAKYGVDTTYTDYEEMIDREELDGVIVAVWHSAHYEVARTCLERGLHVMLEKPMVLVADHARELVELAARQERELIIGYPWHFTPHTLRAREIIQSGELGPVQLVNSVFASMVLQFMRGKDEDYQSVFEYPVVGPGDVYSDPERSGGGQGHLQVTHSAALFLFITGLHPVGVSALMNNLDVKVDVIDAFAVRFQEGALATVGSTGAIVPGGPDCLLTRIHCEHGMVDLDSLAGTCRIHHKDQTEEMLPPLQDADEIYPMGATSANLVDVITGDAANGSPAEFGWRTVELLDAAYRSAGSGGQHVEVNSLYE
jgi:predicted dehydrogenase